MVLLSNLLHYSKCINVCLRLQIFHSFHSVGVSQLLCFCKLEEKSHYLRLWTKSSSSAETYCGAVALQ